MSLSFREMSLWGHTILILLIFGKYFWTVMSAGLFNGPEALPIMGVAIIAFIVAEIAYHILIAIVFDDDKTDERDRQINYRGTLYAAWVLGIGVMLLMGHLALNEAFGPLDRALTTIGVINVLFATLVMAELVEHSSQLLYYRLGV